MCILHIIDYINIKNRKARLEDKYILKGGGKKYKIEMNDIIEKDIIFREIYRKDEKLLILNKNKNECVIIYINEKENIVELRSLTMENGKCIDLEDFGLKTTGKFHLKVAIKMLKKYKDKFKINKIVLEDIATVKCNETEFPLSSYMLLTKGYTFYGKEGFEYVEKDYNDLLKKYKNYILKLKVKDVDMKDIIKKSKNRELNKDIINNAKDNKNMLFVNFLGILFSRENMLNDEICELYFVIRNKLIFYYQNKLGADYLNLFMTNLKMEMKL
jgi:hypothetical protein